MYVYMWLMFYCDYFAVVGKLYPWRQKFGDFCVSAELMVVMGEIAASGLELFDQCYCFGKYEMGEMWLIEAQTV